VARDLLGLELLKAGVGGPIVEVEAYHQDEPASHSHRGMTARNRSMFLTGGHIYVYRIHQSICANVVTGAEGEGQAVLIRALLPRHGRDQIAQRRGERPERIWTDGPGKLCSALAISLADDGQDVLAESATIRLIDRGVRLSDEQIARTPRVGISKATDLTWRLVATTLDP
jgi:DNA-3-methyladenine glycosylase